MSRYHSKRGPVEGCPQRDTNPIAPGSVVQAKTQDQCRMDASRTCGPGQLRWQPMSETDLEWAREQARKAGVRL